MRQWIVALLCAALAVCVTGCGGASTAPDGAVLNVYYAADPQEAQGGDILTAAPADWEENVGLPAPAQAQAALELLLGGCDASGFTSPVPAGTQLLGCVVNGGTAEVDFSSAYGELSGMDLTIADYCVTLTLTQISPIHVVHILVEGRELSYRSSNRFLASDALLSSTEDVVRTFAARLYFADGEGALSGEDRLLTLYEGESRGAVILNALIDGPENPELQALLPEHFEILSLRTENSVCYLNLPAADEELLPEDAESQQLLVESIVRSFCSVDGVDAVQILLDGEMRGALGTVDISQPLSDPQ